MLKRHRQASARAQRKECLGLDWMTGDHAQLVMLCYSSQDQLHLHQRKVVADAYAWSTSEWEVGVVGATSSLYWGKALRVEHLRVLPKSRMAVGYVGA